MSLYTSYWAQLHRHRDDLAELRLLPVRISMQSPKFWWPAVTYPAIDELAPVGLWRWFNDPTEFTLRYLDRLESFGIDVVLERIAEIREGNPGKTLVFCCFESVETACHRDLFRDWYLRQTGELIEEWTPPVVGDRLAVEERA